MNKRPGQVTVTTEVAYCSFCGRPRNLRREERQLGALVRTTVTCETCHRTLSSSVGVATAEAEAEPAAAAAAPALEGTEEPIAPKAAPAEKTPAKRATKSAPAAAKPKTPARRASKSK